MTAVRSEPGHPMDPEPLKPEDPSTTRSLDGGAKAQKPRTPLTALGPYRILSEIGRGGMGVVYKAYHAELKRTVALKVLAAGEDASDDALARFHREAESVAKLGHHSNIVPVYDMGLEGRLHYFAMHCVEGRSLEELIDSEELTPRRAAEIALRLALALHHAHSHAILHRDVKPANVLVTAHGEPQLTDFGLARDVDSESSLTRSGVTLGTPLYMPPEQADGRVDDIDARSDVYSLGATLYEMLTFEPPFSGTVLVNLIYDILLKDPVPPRRLNPEVPRDLDTICLHCLEKSRDRRYASALELARDLERFLNGESILARPPSLFDRMSRWAVRQQTALVAAIVVFLFTAGLAGVFLLAQSAEERPRPSPPSAAPASPAVSPQARKDASVKFNLGKRYLTQAEKSIRRAGKQSRRELLLKALEAFSAALELDRERTEAYIEKGKVLMLLERMEDAFKAFTQAVDLNPDLCDAYYNRLLIRNSRFLQTSLMGGGEGANVLRAGIQADLTEIERIGTNPEMSLCGRSVLHTLEGDYEHALEKADEAVSKNPYFSDAYAARANARRMLASIKSPAQGKPLYEAALKDLNEALALAEWKTSIRLHRAGILFRLERKDEALQEMDRVIQELPDRPYGYLQRAQFRVMEGDVAGYEKDMAKADSLGFETADDLIAAAGTIMNGVQFGLQHGLTLEHLDQALVYLDKVVKEYPQRTEVFILRGLVHRMLGNKMKALSDFDGYLAHHPTSRLAPIVYVFSGQLELGKPFEDGSAEDTYQEAMAFFSVGQSERAEGLYRQTLELIAQGHPPKTRHLARLWGYMKISSRVNLARLLSQRAGARDTSREDSLKLAREALTLMDEAVKQGFRDFPVLEAGPYKAMRDLDEYPARRRSWGK